MEGACGRVKAARWARSWVAHARRTRAAGCAALCSVVLYLMPVLLPA